MYNAPDPNAYFSTPRGRGRGRGRGGAAAGSPLSTAMQNAQSPASQAQMAELLQMLSGNNQMPNQSHVQMQQGNHVQFAPRYAQFAARPPQMAPSAMSSPPSASLQQQLSGLQQMRDTGGISEQQYQQLMASVLAKHGLLNTGAASAPATPGTPSQNQQGLAAGRTPRTANILAQVQMSQQKATEAQLDAIANAPARGPGRPPSVPVPPPPVVATPVMGAPQITVPVPRPMRNPVLVEPKDDGKLKPLVSRERIEELARQVDPDEKMDPEVIELLYELSDNFISSTTTLATRLALHRGAPYLEPKDLAVPLERLYGIRVPGLDAKVPGIEETEVKRTTRSRAGAGNN